MNVLVQNHKRFTTAKAIYSVAKEKEKRSIYYYTLLITANKPETALYRAPTFSFLLVSHGGLVCVYILMPVLFTLWYGVSYSARHKNTITLCVLCNPF